MFENTNKKDSFLDNHFLTSVFLIIACLILFVVFPSGDAVQKFTGQIFFLVLVPAAYIKFILKKNLADFGLNIKNIGSGLFWGIIGLAIVLAGTYSAMNYTSFSDSYALPGYVANNFWLFLLYELVFVNISIFCFEFFLRGFVLFSLSSKLSYWSVLIQSALYFFILISFQKNPEQIAFGLTLSVILGFITYKTKSIAYSYAIILISSIIIDAYLISLLSK